MLRPPLRLLRPQRKAPRRRHSKLKPPRKMRNNRLPHLKPPQKLRKIKQKMPQTSHRMLSNRLKLQLRVPRIRSLLQGCLLLLL